MSWLSDVGGWIGNAASDVGGLIFGTGKNPGALGTGQYQVQAPEVNGQLAMIPGSEQYRQQMAQQQQVLQQRATPTSQAAQIDTSQANQVRAGQQRLAGDLLAASRGQGPSVAQEQLRQGTERNLAGAVALANSQRGMGAASGAAQLQAARAQAGQQMASDAALLRAQEVSQARAQAGGVLGDMRQTDLATAGQQAQLNQQTNLANQQALLADQARKDDLTRQYISMGLSAAQAEQAAAYQMEQLRVNAALDVEQLRSGAYGDTAARRSRVAENAARAIGQAAGAGSGGAGGAAGGGG